MVGKKFSVLGSQLSAYAPAANMTFGKVCSEKAEKAEN